MSSSSCCFTNLAAISSCACIYDTASSELWTTMKAELPPSNQPSLA